MREPNRIQPALPVGTMKTYQILAPMATHRRKATCAEFGCDAYRLGWVSKIDESTELGKAQAYYIRNQSGRSYTETRGAHIDEPIYGSLDTYEPRGTVVWLGGSDAPGDEPIPHDRTYNGYLTLFSFEAGQEPFSGPQHEHTVPIGRPELFIVRGGDWRGNPTGEHRQHTRPEDWVDDFANNQLSVAQQIQKG